MKQIDFLVCVRCFTFNHAPYIKDAMDGFCMQETSFPFVCVIVDDASIDGEPNIIRTYMGQHFNIDDKNVVRNVETDDYVMTFAQHKVNENCFFAVYYLKYNHYSIKKDKFPYFAEYHDNAKYIALCEGDDYWVDSKKLQKQVDVLESKPNVTMVYSAFETVNSSKEYLDIKKYRDYMLFSRSGDVFPRLLWRNHILTLTVCYRRELVNDSDIYNEAPCKLDYLTFLSAAAAGDLYYLQETTGCYRITSTGAVATQSQLIYERLNTLCEYFSMLYVSGRTKRTVTIYGRFVSAVVILARAFRKKGVLWKIIKKKRVYVLILPFAFLIKTIDYIGLRYLPGYNEYTLYNFFDLRKA